MVARKTKNAAAKSEEDENVAPFRHRYPTRWSLRSSLSGLSPHSQVVGVEDKAKGKVIADCKKRKEARHIPYLPTEVIFNILLLLPAEVLHKVVRYVCEQWYNIVSDPRFSRMHSKLCSAGLLIQDAEKVHQVLYIETDTAGLKVTEIQIPIRAVLLGSCNGNVLLRDLRSRETFHVMNLVTKAKVSLPPVLGLCKLFGDNGCCRYCPTDLRYTSTGICLDSSGHYKVVHVSGMPCRDEVTLMVFTVGVDKAWRIIDLQLQGIPMNIKVIEVLLWEPRITAGFLHWGSHIASFCLVMDVNTETVYQVPLPMPFNRILDGLTNFFSTGTSLGLIWQECEWRFWTLTNVKSGEWTRMPVIDGKALFRSVNKSLHTRGVEDIEPAMFVNDDFWFYRCTGKRFVLGRYNLANKRIEYVRINRVTRLTILHPHLHTLLSPKDC